MNYSESAWKKDDEICKNYIKQILKKLVVIRNLLMRIHDYYEIQAIEMLCLWYSH